MSDDIPPPNIDAHLCKLLDAGHRVMLARNGMGSYTAVILPADLLDADMMIPTSQYTPDSDDEDEDDTPTILSRLMDAAPEHGITDDFTPTKAIRRLAEKFLHGVIVE